MWRLAVSLAFERLDEKIYSNSVFKKLKEVRKALACTTQEKSQLNFAETC